jgi:hypothetical protein
MTALQRKENTERILATYGLVIVDDLPLLEEEHAIILRTSQEIAQRILILTYLNCVATDHSLRQEVMMFLIHQKLWNHVTEEEKDLFHKTELTEGELSTILWRAESIWILLWSINKVDELELPNQEVDLQAIFPLLPGFFEPTDEFIRTASIRATSEILDQADFVFRLNWALREASLKGSPSTLFNESIAYERFFAINWVTGMRERWVDSQAQNP